MKKLLLITLFSLIFILNGISKSGPIETLMLSQPAIHGDSIAFVYANDIWIYKSGTDAPRRLTSTAGTESNPIFSPDGKFIAFSGNYDGNTDVYIVDSRGGIPKRLTWHPYGDIARGFTPDGKKVVFASGRYSSTRGRTKLFSVSLNGSFPRPIILPFANKLTYSPNGEFIAYIPYGEVYNEWKNYRGGTHTEVWIFSKQTKITIKVPQPAGGCNDTDPFWIGDNIYFRSDRNGEFNLFSYDTKAKDVVQLTSYNDFPILNIGADNKRIIYEQAGKLHIFDTGSKNITSLKIVIKTDLKEVRPRYSSNPRFIRSADISPSGSRAVFGYRGEVITVPAKKGDPRNLTNSTAVHDRFPAWSPNGEKIAYFSDKGGEYGLVIENQDGKSKTKFYKLNGAGFYTNISWSPDSKKLAFTDNARNIFWMEVNSGKVKKITSEPHYAPGTYGSMICRWSHDSSFITYHLNNTAEMSQVYIYSLKSGKNMLVTDGLSDVSEPVFDQSGKYIYFLVSTDAGPVKHWFDMSNDDKRMSSSIFLATLQSKTPSPFAKESDEVNKKKKQGKKKTTPAKKESMTIDFEGFERRIIDLPITKGSYYNLQSGNKGEIYFLEYDFASGKSKLHRYNLKKKKNEVLGSGIRSYVVSNDGKKLLVQYRRGWAIVPAGKIKPGSGMLKTSSISVKIDPIAEWKQIFDEAWRVNRDYFYDPNMHGVDWKAMKKKYSVFLPHLATRRDLYRLIQWMCSELGVGHHRGGGGEYIDRAKRIPGGLLGADFSIVKNRYQFKKVYGGLNWNPKLRSPLTEPGVNVKKGEFLLRVNGRALIYPENIFSHFENSSGKIVELTIGSDEKGTNSREVKVVPVSAEYSLRNRDWVEKNLAYVTKKSSGRVAYVYVPNTTTMGHTYFKRYFYPQTNREAVIVDERFNGGGQIADYYIDMLKKRYNCSWAYRYGKNQHSPSSAIFGPKVLLINEMAGSGGDLFPWMWKQAKLGKIIGKRTWGGLVGVLGFPTLMDGGYITAPNVGFWTEKEGFGVENIGVPPDIEIEQNPKLMIEGKDPQLDRAIKEIMKELKKNPVKKPKRPPFPIKFRKK